MIRKLEFGYDVDKPAKNFDPCDLSMYHQSRDSIYYADVTADLSVCTPLPGPSVIEFGSVVYERKLWKAEVVITTPETFTKGDSGDELRHIDWQVLVMDEAHRLKNSRSRISQTLSSDIKYDFKLGLTGTPLQNNMSELWSLLHFVDPLKFPKEEEEDSDSNVEIQQFTEKRFNDKFEGISDSKILSKLHEVIGSYILRRLKEDVEKSGEAEQGAKQRTFNAISSNENNAPSYFHTNRASSVTTAIIFSSLIPTNFAIHFCHCSSAQVRNNC